MKRIFTVLTLLIVLISCGGSSNELQKKKDELTKKKKELVKLQKEIAELEEYVAKNDTSEKAKDKQVDIQTVSVQPFQHFIEIQGTIDSDQNAFVSPAAPG